MRKTSSKTAFLKDIRVSQSLIFLYFKNKNFRINFSLLLSVFLNTVYVIFNAVYGIVYESFWFISVSVYYTMLAVLSGAVLKTKRVAEVAPNEAHRAYFRIGALLIIMELVMMPIMIYSAVNRQPFINKGFVLAELIIFSLFSVVRAFYAIIQSGKTNNRGSRAAYIVRAISTTTSLFNLSIVLFPSGQKSDASLILLSVFMPIFMIGISYMFLSSLMLQER